MRSGVSPKKPWGRARIRGVDVVAFAIVWPFLSIFVVLRLLSFIQIPIGTELIWVFMWLFHCWTPIVLYAFYARSRQQDWFDIIMNATLYLIPVTIASYAWGVYWALTWWPSDL